MIENNAVETAPPNKLSVLATKIPVIAQLKRLVERAREWKFAIWAGQYNYSQGCYFVAGLLVAWNFIYAQEPSYILAGWVAFIGLVRELLHLFQHIWDNLIGKTVILILYASTANIAIAYAAMQINSITGIEPTPFVFALGFTALVLLPVWVTLSTIIVFSFFLIAVNLWLLVRLPLKMIGFNVQLHWEDKKNAVLTMLLRIFLIPFAVTSVLTFTYPYFADFVDEPLGIENQNFLGDNSHTSNGLESDSLVVKPKQSPIDNESVDLPKQQKLDSNEPLTSAVHEGENQLPTSSKVNVENQKESTALTITDAFRTGNLDEDINLKFSLPNNNDGLANDSTNSKKPVRQLIAHFIWYLEAYPRSKCIKPDAARTVPIDEIAVLVITQNKEAELGYNYEVIECELRNQRN